MSEPEPVRQTLADLVAAYAALAAEEKRAKAAQAELRPEIAAILNAEYNATGMLPSHRLPGVGTVDLRGGQPSVLISDAAAYAEWVAERYPEAVSLVVTIPRRHVDSDQFQRVLETLKLLSTSMESVVTTSTLDVLIAEGSADVGTGKLVTSAGEAVDGVSVSKTLPRLWVTPAKPANRDDDAEGSS